MNETTKSKNIVVPVLVILLIAAAFGLGSLWTKVQYLEGNGGGTKVANNNPTGTGTDTTGDNAVPDGTPTKNPNLPKPNDKDHYQGNLNAKVALIEYSDFECPFCKRFYPTVQQMIKEYGDKVLYVYRHFPLSSIHPYAQKMAEASECVYKLGGAAKFWEFESKMADDAEGKLTDQDLPTVASQIGVDSASVKACLDSNEMASIVNAQYTDGLKAGVSGTPGNFIMNLKTEDIIEVRGAVPYAQLKSAIDTLMAK